MMRLRRVIVMCVVLATNGAYATSATAAPRFDQPVALAFGGGGNLFVAEFELGEVVKVSPAGTVLARWHVHFANGRQDDPSGIALSPSGTVYVTDEGSNVYVFSPSGHESVWNGELDPEHSFQNTSGVAVDSQGHVFVGEYPQAGVMEFAAAGHLLGQWPESARYLAIDRRGHRYLSNFDRGLILKFGAKGGFQRQFGSGVLYEPMAVVVNARGVWVANYGRDQIVHFAPTGRVLGIIQVSGPEGLALDARGNVWATTGGRIDEFSPSGRLILSWP